jgi:hypothetical protein
MIHAARQIVLCLILTAVGSCVPDLTNLIYPPALGRYEFANATQNHYVAMAARLHVEQGQAEHYAVLPLLPPGASARGDWEDLLGTGCPDALDVRVYVYRRVNEDVPVGLNKTDPVEPTPVFAGEVRGVPACNAAFLDLYRILAWVEPGVLRVEFSSSDAVKAEILRLGLFGEGKHVWDVTGVDPVLAGVGPPERAPLLPIEGRATLVDGTGVENVAVLLHTSVRYRLPDSDPTNDPDSAFGDPIAVAKTDATGAFRLDWPAGAYLLQFSADDYLFRQWTMVVHPPVHHVLVLVEPQ